MLVRRMLKDAYCIILHEEAARENKRKMWISSRKRGTNNVKKN
jgi:hypothetical protein